MKNLIFYLFILMCFSCKKNDLKQATNESLANLNENNQKKKNNRKLKKNYKKRHSYSSNE